MNPSNLRLKEIMQKDPEEITDDDMVLFANELIDSNLIMLCELESDDEVLYEKEYLNFEAFDDFSIIRLEDDDGNEFIPLFTDNEELNKFEVPGYGVIVSMEDLFNLLIDNNENNDDLEGLILNPFTDYAVSIPYSSLLEMFGLVECDDPECNHEHHS